MSKSKQILIPIALFILFYSYRIYFWGEFEKYGLQEFFNALGDSLISWYAGAFIYNCNERYPIVRKLLHFPSVMIVFLAAVILYAYHLLIYLSFARLTPDFKSWFNSICFQLLDSLTMIITGALVHIVVRYASERKKLQENVRELTEARDQAELNFLKSRIDSHFIFNGLNNIFHEISHENARARETVLQFSEIMRYHLQHAEKDKVKAMVELNYIESFVNFQHNRMSDFIDLEKDFSIHDPQSSIEPFLLLPFIENAFKFCEPVGANKGKISMDLKFSNGELCFNVCNSYNPKTVSNLKGNCFGLKNVLKRLELIYGENYQLFLQDDKHKNLYYCHLKILL